MGTSQNFKSILKPLGIEKSISYAEDFLNSEHNKKNHSLNKNKITKRDFDLYQYLGNKILKYGNNKIKMQATIGKRINWQTIPKIKSLGLLTTLKKSLVERPKPRPSMINAKAIGAILVTISIIKLNLNYFRI